MFSSLMEGIRGTPRPSNRAEATRASSTETAHSALTGDAFNAQSSSSTPPTSIGDGASVSSTSLKRQLIETTPVPESAGRSRRQRTSVGTYNVKVLSGTAIHAPRKYLKNKPDTGNDRRATSGETLVGLLASESSSPTGLGKSTRRLGKAGIGALDLAWSAKKSLKAKTQAAVGRDPRPKKSAKQLDLERRKSTREVPIETLERRLSILGKRNRQPFDDSLVSQVKRRELRNLADTAEFAKIDTKPVIHEVWSNGKLVVAEPVKKKRKVEEAPLVIAKPVPVELVQEKKVYTKKNKTWLAKGLYAGQQSKPLDSHASQKLKKLNEHRSGYNPNGSLPFPMFNAQQLLLNDRDFKLPFDVCAPLPPGQAKPDEWRKTSSNRFVGEASALWKKSSLFDSFSSKCVCTPEGGCGDRCQNKIMLYECDDTNCASGREVCTNRAFAQLQERRKGGGKYRIGVEVIKTPDRGYGVRSNRCFDPNQIIVEYTGEIITEDECDRRMNEDYVDNDCYYLMSFDQNMIIDATKGSIARFVNHSCKPNCKMVKWIVGGKPRMALFAGDNPIMSGDELTYDYNFDPFSAKNVQECRCGSDNCRGVLGPRPKDQKNVKEVIKDAVKAGVKAGKRKLKELLGGASADAEDRSPKKRKIKEAIGVRRTKSSASIRLAKGAATTIRKTVSSTILNARQAVGAKAGTAVVVKSRKPKAKTTTTNTTRRAYSKRSKIPSRKLSMNLAATSSAESTPLRTKTTKKVISKKTRKSPSKASPSKTRSPKKAAVPVPPPIFDEEIIEAVPTSQNNDDDDETEDDTTYSLITPKILKKLVGA